MTVAGALFQLEQLDSDLERGETELGEMRKRLSKNPQLKSAEAKLDALRKQEQEASGEQRTLESDLNDIAAKIKRDQTRMYSGQIVDPRELSSLEKELEHYGQRRDEMEERCLECMERVEGLQAQIAEANRQAIELRAHWETDQPMLTRQLEQRIDELAEMAAKREQITGDIDPRSLGQYRRVRTSLGHAVSHVSGGVCQWCHVSIPAKDMSLARGEALVTCSNCGRILYVG